MASKSDLARAGTMQVTAKEGTAYLEKNLTEWKKPHMMTPEEKKVAKLAKHSTMKGTAKEAKELLGGEELSDTRQETTKAKKRKSSAALKKETSVAKTIAEAQAVYGKLDTSAGRSLRKRAAPPPAPKPAKKAKPGLKKARTMVETAKEGKNFVKGKKTWDK